MARVLYIGLDYYHYPQVISEEFNNQGYEVDYFSIEPASFFFKASRYVANSLYRRRLDEYHQKIIESTKNNRYDIVFFITSHFFSLDNLAALRDSHRSARFIAYHWDSLEQYNYLGTLPYFDKVFSFDKQDCLEHGFEYLPLFSSGIYQESTVATLPKNIDIYTVSSIVKVARYIMLDDLRTFCNENGISYHFHLKVTPVTYLMLLIRGIIPKGVSFNAMDKDEMKAVADRSTAVLDVANHKQSGLTMRVIENICIGTKVITTNQNIIDEEFYSPEQVFLLTDFNRSEIKPFIDRDVEIRTKPQLLISSWLSKILV